MPYQPLQRTIWSLAPGVQVILRQAPIPLLPARHCFLASEALLALCDPESRIQHSSGSRAPRPASPRVSSCLSLRASSPRQTSWEGAIPADVCALSYLHQTPGSVAHASSSPPHPSTGRALRRTTRRSGLTFGSSSSAVLRLQTASSRAASGCCDDTALHSSSHPFQPSWSRVKEGANHGRPGKLAPLPGVFPALIFRYWYTCF